MREKILLNIDNPLQLEKLYRDNKPVFTTVFNALYPELETKPMAQFWNQRLNFSHEEMFWGTAAERLFVFIACIFAGFVAQFPKIFSLDQEFFYSRNIGFIVFPVLIAYFAWKNDISRKTIIWMAGLILAAIVFINYLPKSDSSDTLVLCCIHLPLLLWSLLGFAFGGGRLRNSGNWLGFLRYNGELAVMSAILLISGGLVTGLTVNLFHMIGLNIEKFYFDYVVVVGLAAVPLIGTFLTQVQPTIVGKVSPVIAKLFSPVALVMLLVYLGAMIFSGKNPYQDREFLLLFNALLVGVMALIFFSVADADRIGRNSGQIIVLLLLSVITILVNGIALSAVLFRISEWGITPNRAAVLGANALMLLHLVLVGIKIWKALNRKSDLNMVGRAIVLFLPIYGIWTAIVTFLFPLLFGFK